MKAKIRLSPAQIFDANIVIDVNKEKTHYVIVFRFENLSEKIPLAKKEIKTLLTLNVTENSNSPNNSAKSLNIIVKDIDNNSFCLDSEKYYFYPEKKDFERLLNLLNGKLLINFDIKQLLNEFSILEQRFFKDKNEIVYTKYFYYALSSDQQLGSEMTPLTVDETNEMMQLVVKEVIGLQKKSLTASLNILEDNYYQILINYLKRDTKNLGNLSCFSYELVEYIISFLDKESLRNVSMINRNLFGMSSKFIKNNKVFEKLSKNIDRYNLERFPVNSQFNAKSYMEILEVEQISNLDYFQNLRQLEFAVNFLERYLNLSELKQLSSKSWSDDAIKNAIVNRHPFLLLRMADLYFNKFQYSLQKGPKFLKLAILCCLAALENKLTNKMQIWGRLENFKTLAMAVFSENQKEYVEDKINQIIEQYNSIGDKKYQNIVQKLAEYLQAINFNAYKKISINKDYYLWRPHQWINFDRFLKALLNLKTDKSIEYWLNSSRPNYDVNSAIAYLQGIIYARKHFPDNNFIESSKLIGCKTEDFFRENFKFLTRNKQYKIKLTESLASVLDANNGIFESDIFSVKNLNDLPRVMINGGRSYLSLEIPNIFKIFTHSKLKKILTNKIWGKISKEISEIKLIKGYELLIGDFFLNNGDFSINQFHDFLSASLNNVLLKNKFYLKTYNVSDEIKTIPILQLLKVIGVEWFLERKIKLSDLSNWWDENESMAIFLLKVYFFRANLDTKYLMSIEDLHFLDEIILLQNNNSKTSLLDLIVFEDSKWDQTLIQYIYKIDLIAKNWKNLLIDILKKQNFPLNTVEEQMSGHCETALFAVLMVKYLSSYHFNNYLNFFSELKQLCFNQNKRLDFDKLFLVLDVLDNHLKIVSNVTNVRVDFDGKLLVEHIERLKIFFNFCDWEKMQKTCDKLAINNPALKVTTGVKINYFASSYNKVFAITNIANVKNKVEIVNDLSLNYNLTLNAKYFDCEVTLIEALLSLSVEDYKKIFDNFGDSLKATILRHAEAIGDTYKNSLKSEEKKPTLLGKRSRDHIATEDESANKNRNLGFNNN